MKPALRGELRKVLATPTIWWLLLVTVAIGIIGTAAPLVVAKKDAANLLTEKTLRQAMHGAAAGVILVVVAGVIGTAGEYRFGRASQTYLTSPNRSRVIAAKTLVYLAVGAVFGAVADAAAAVSAWIVYRANGVAFPFDRSAVWLTLLGCLAVAVLFGALGVGIGAVCRNQVVAIVVAMTWLNVEPVLFEAFKGFRWLPIMASFSLRRQPINGLLSMGTAASVLIAVVVAVLGAGLVFVERSDVTA